jgi:hypothetical protein
LHVVAFAHTRPPAHGVGSPGEHVPDPLHVEVVSSPFEHDVPHVVPLLGNTHAPVVALHPVAPHAPPIGEQAAAQQSPVPETPQTMLVHASFVEHAPAATRWMQAPAEQ